MATGYVKLETSTADSSLGRLQSSFTNLREDMQHQSLENKTVDVSEELQMLRQDLLKKNLEIEQLRDVLNKTGTSGPTAISLRSHDAHSNVPPATSTSRDAVKLSEKYGSHFGVKISEVVDSPKDATVYKSEIEDLRLKLETATQICAQQENHFSNLIRELEDRLGQAIAGRDELLALRQKESGTQHQLIQNFQLTLQETKQSLELRNEELLDSQTRMKSDREKLTRAHTVLVKVENVLRSEEAKRGATSMLTGFTTDYEIPNTGDLLIQVLTNCLREDDTRIIELVMKCQELERQLLELKETNEAEKIKFIKDYERKVTQLESDHTKSLDIAASRTLSERDRIAELTREIDDNRKKYVKTISGQENIINSLEEKQKTCHLELEEKCKAHEIQHTKDATVIEEMEKRIVALQKGKDEMLKGMMLTTTSEKLSVEKITTLEGNLTEAAEKSKTLKQNFQEIEKEHVDNISRLKQTLEEKNAEIRRIITDRKEELKQKTELMTLERDEASRKYEALEEHHKESSGLIGSLQEEMKLKTREVSKCLEDIRALRVQEETLSKERDAISRGKADLSAQCETSSQKISRLKEEKSTLSNMIRNNVHDLTRAKTIIDSLQAKLDEQESDLEAYNKQDAALAEILMKKHLVGETLLHERQHIVGFLEEKIREVDELKGIRDALAHKLETKIQILNELQCTCRSLDAKVEVRSNELEAIMEDRNKLLLNLKSREGELGKIKEERDSLVTLMNGKQSEKEREVNKLISRLKGSQHDLALTKKVLEAKREANGKAIKMATMTQEEITAKRKQVDALKDRITWLQESLQATAEEKVGFENKACELANELERANYENESLKLELAQFTKSYDEASGRVRHMEKALEKAGIKFAETQALVEKLEQDLAKIKLQYSLEVKELQRKVMCVPERDTNVHVVQTLRPQQVIPGVRENPLKTTKEFNATQQRLLDEAEMTKGFKVLLKDLHELMNDIKDSGAILRKSTTMVERSTSTVDINSRHEDDRRKTELRRRGNDDSKSLNDKTEDSMTITRKATETMQVARYKGEQDRQKNIRRPNSAKVRAPLRSSSPKRSSLDVDQEKKVGITYEHSVSDISDVEPDLTADQSSLQKERQGKAEKPNSQEDILKLKQKTSYSSNENEDDVESLIMSKEIHEGSHGRAQNILDLLTVKGQELKIGNQRIAELIGRQHDGIRRCRETEQNIKMILK